MNLFALAWRNVWRNGRRSGVTIAATALALWVMLLYSALVEGYLRSMEADVLDFEVGEIQVSHPDYRDDPSLYNRVDDAAALVARLEGAGYRVSPRLLAGGLAAAGEASAGVSLRGLDLTRDGDVLRVSERLMDGSWLDPSDPEGAVIGGKLARTLGVGVGDEIVVLSQGTDGSLANDLFLVRGVLGPVGPATDTAGIFVLEQVFRDLLVVPDGAHQVIVRPPAGVGLAEAAAAVAELAPDARVDTWKQLMPTIATMLESTRGMIMIVFVIIYIAIGILILNAMLMAVFERIREFGVMKALGVGPLMVLALIVLETAIQTALAMAIGGALAVPAGYYLATVGIDLSVLAGASIAGLSMPPIWRCVFTPATVAGPVVVLVTIVSLAVIYPAIKAARIRPVDAMRYH